MAIHVERYRKCLQVCIGPLFLSLTHCLLPPLVFQSLLTAAIGISEATHQTICRRKLWIFTAKGVQPSTQVFTHHVVVV